MARVKAECNYGKGVQSGASRFGSPDEIGPAERVGKPNPYKNSVSVAHSLNMSPKNKLMNLDFPLPFFITTQHRSGSNFLMDLLNSTGLVTVREFRANVKRDTFESILDTDEGAHVLPPMRLCYENFTARSDYEQWGLSIHAAQMIICDHLLNCGCQPNAIKWIWLVRRNKVAQALSFIRANETQIFGMKKDVPNEMIEHNDMEISVPREELLRLALRFYFLDEVWQTFFNTHNITPYKIYYEDFIDPSTWETTISDVLGYLCVPHNRPLNIQDATLVQSPKEKPRAYYEVLKMLRLPVLIKKYLPFKVDYFSEA